MTITLNGFPLNDGSNGVWIKEVDGLEMPAIRTSTGNYAGRDGGFVGAQYFSPRDISIQGMAFSSSVSGLEAVRQQLQSALLGDAVTMNIVTNGGNSYTVSAFLLDFQMPIKDNIFSAAYKIELLATDPIIYSNVNAGTATLTPIVTSGFTIPFTLPLTLPASSLPTTITNAGVIAVYPTITMAGTATNPILTNNTTSEFFGLSLTTTNTDTISINMANRTVTLNGSSVFGDVSAGSDWWFLQPGGNAVSLTTSSGADTVTTTITWQSGYIGI